MEGIEAEDMNSLFEQFETHDDDITQGNGLLPCELLQ